MSKEKKVTLKSSRAKGWTVVATVEGDRLSIAAYLGSSGSVHPRTRQLHRKRWENLGDYQDKEAIEDRIWSAADDVMSVVPSRVRREVCRIAVQLEVEFDL